MKLFIKQFLNKFATNVKHIDINEIEKIIVGLSKIKKNKGRIFFIGVGGSAANATHAVNDFRKIANIECYSPSDNSSELTARVNDEGWNSSYVEYLKVSKLSKNDCIFILSVGGGNKKYKISENIISCIDYAKKIKSKIFGIVGPLGGYAYKKGDNVVKIKAPDELITPFSESFQILLLHLIVSSKELKENMNKWESQK
ncbi:MAG: sugar isomerase [Rhodospirillaceae bacterium]|nr:sugar isomerase [Rhodospirillaceae bacterium]|tara:strand:- start:184 stop:780 length:597 start_codon:yes stop_codon:yes gene_type:complete